MIHHNVFVLFFVLILLISCCVVAASLITENTNMGVAVFVAFLRAAACSHQFIFHCLEVLFWSTSLLCAISCKAFPGRTYSVDVDRELKLPSQSSCVDLCVQ